MKHEDSLQKAHGSLEDAIIELYLNVKLRKQEAIDRYTESALEVEKERLRKTNPITLIGYIKKSIEILIDLKVQERLHQRNTNQEEFCARYGNDEGINEYEKLLRKSEADIRNYIKIEHQLKLHAEAMQIRNEELEKTIDAMKEKCNYSEGPVKPSERRYSEEDIESYKKEIAHLQQIIKSYEQHNLKIPVLEKKLRNQKIEMKNMDSFYKEKLRSYSKRLERYEEVLKSNTSQLLISDITVKSQGGRNDIIDTTSITSRTPSPDFACKTARMREGDTNNISPCKIKTDQIKKSTGKRMNDTIKSIIGDLKLINTKDNSIIDRGSIHSNEISRKSNEKSKVNLTAGENTLDLGKCRDREREREKVDYSEIQSGTEHRKIDSLSFIVNNAPESRSTLMQSKRIDSLMVDNAVSNSKSIHSMMVKEKDAVKSSQRGLSTVTGVIVKHPQVGINANNSTANPNNNININQQGLPCFNNINIFTGGINNVKAGDINLRQYIFNKIGNTRKKQLGGKHLLGMSNIQGKLVHARSSSALGNK